MEEDTEVQGGDEDATKPEAAPTDEQQPVVDVAKLDLWSKFNADELHCITRGDVERLFSILDPKCTGLVSAENLVEELRKVPKLQLSDEDFEALLEDCDKDGDGKLSCEELFKGLTEGQVTFSLVKRSLNRKNPNAIPNSVEREQILHWLNEEYNTSGALWSLPQTMLLLVCFTISTLTHLDLDNAYKMQSALAVVLSAGDAGPGADGLSFPNGEEFMKWMSTTYLAPFDHNLMSSNPYPGRIAAEQQLVGGITFERTYAEAIPCSPSSAISKIFDPAAGLCFGLGEPVTDRRVFLYQWSMEEMTGMMQNLTASKWVGREVTQVDIGHLFFNGPTQTYTSTHLVVKFPVDGVPVARFIQESFNADPFMGSWWPIPDAIFCIIILRMLYAEGQELLPAAFGGFTSLLAYLGFWNCIDWLAIIFGIAISSVLGAMYKKINDLGDGVLALPNRDLDAKILELGAYLTAAQVSQVVPQDEMFRHVEDIVSLADEISEMQSNLRLLTFFYFFVLMMKFFKAFQANPRLNIVVETLLRMLVDLAHFGIVLGVIYLVYSLSACVAFGSDMPQWSDLGDSMMSGFRLVLGDVDYTTMWKTNSFLNYVWFTSFFTLVGLILLNFLMAIIMDSYAAAKEAVEDPVTIWDQVREAISTLRETQGYLDLWLIICEFEDENYPAHPGKVVTGRSLRRAFETQKMTKANADYLVQKCQDWLKQKEGELDVTLVDAIRILAQIKTEMLHVSEISEHTLGVIQEDLRKLRGGGRRIEGGAALQGVESPGVSHSRPQTPVAFPRDIAATPTGMFAGGQPQVSWSIPPSSAVQQPIANLRQLAHSQDGVAGLDAIGTKAGDSGEPSAVALREPGTRAATPALAQLAGEMLRAEQRKATQLLEKRLREHQEFLEQEDDWHATRSASVELRVDKMERATERLLNALKLLDLTELAQMPRVVADLSLQWSDRGQNHRKGCNKQTEPPDLAADMENQHEASVLVEVATEAVGKPVNRVNLLEQRLDALTLAVEKLIVAAEESAGIQQLLWSVDLSFRQLRSGLSSGNGSLEEPSRANDSPSRGAPRQQGSSRQRR